MEFRSKKDYYKLIDSKNLGEKPYLNDKQRDAIIKLKRRKKWNKH